MEKYTEFQKEYFVEKLKKALKNKEIEADTAILMLSHLAILGKIEPRELTGLFKKLFEGADKETVILGFLRAKKVIEDKELVQV
ncbi:hypothetical protein [Caloranaerobacter sp. DY30410]|uniref:hypothetical protein n=1 Tax=Caloranaerobacter sp. DY30410 TaxID=3238305 RepID=UPI003CFE660B